MKNIILGIILIVFYLSLGWGQTYLEKKEFTQILEKYKKKDYKNTYQLIKNFLEKYPSSYYKPEAYYYYALLEPNYYISVIFYKDIINQFPEYNKIDEVIYRLAKLYFLHSNYTEANIYFDTLIKEYPKSYYFYGAHYYFGLIRLIKNDFKEAITYFDYIIEQEKKDNFYVLAFIGKAHCYFEMKDYKKSIGVLKEIQKKAKANELPGIYYSLGNNYLKLKQYDKSYYYFKKVLKEFPGSSEYELALKKVNYMKNYPTILDKINLDLPEKDKIGPPSKTEEYYTVQISSVQDKRIANDWRIKLKTQNYDAFIEEATIEKKIFYRTYIGKYKTKEDAEKIKNDIDSKFKLNTLVVQIK